jgi:V/A-type H+-transporting ATPase subunit D
MARLALNKSSLKRQRDQLKTYQRFLPSLDLKRQQLMLELRGARRVLAQLEEEAARTDASLGPLAELVGAYRLDLAGLFRVAGVRTAEVNAVGLRLPVLEAVEFETASYSLLSKPFWVDFLVETGKRMVELRLRLDVQRRRVRLLDEAVRKVTQRVNLFEKVLIPSTEENIRKINIFLADAQRVSVVRSKIAKAKSAARSARG